MPFGKIMKKKGALSKVAKKQVESIVKKNQETKYALVDLAAVDITDSIFVRNVMRNADQGITEFTRVGNQVRTVGMRLRVNVKCTSGALATPEANRVRVMIYNPYTVGDVFVPPDLAHMCDRLDPEKFRVLFDKTFVVNTVGGPSGVTFDKWIKWNALCRYDTASGSTIKTNDLTLSFISDSSASPSPTISGYLEVHYKDA